MSDEEKRGCYLKMDTKKPAFDLQMSNGRYVRTTKKRAATAIGTVVEESSSESGTESSKYESLTADILKVAIRAVISSWTWEKEEAGAEEQMPTSNNCPH